MLHLNKPVANNTSLPTHNSTLQRALIIAPAWVGDMLMAQALFTLLQQQNYQVDVLAPPSTLPLAERMPEVQQKILLPIKHKELKLWRRYQIAKSLRDQHYQQAIILPNTFKSALIPWWAKIPRRIGWLGEQRYVLLTDPRRLDPEEYPSLRARYAALALPEHAALSALKNPNLKIDAQNQQHCLQKFNLTIERPILVLCPGAEYGVTKRWPAEYYATVAQHYLAQQWQVWIFGTAKETAAAQIIQTNTEHHCHDLTGKTSLLDAIDLLACAQLAISNDSGLMHLAAATQVPVVAIYGSTSPRYTPPATPRAKILQLDFPCIPCFKRECPLPAANHLRCLNRLLPAQVITAAEELLV